MSKLKWGEVGKKTYETGTDKGVLFVMDDEGAYGEGVAWSGLTGVTQSPDGAEESPLYADNGKYLSLFSVENFKGNIAAYAYPKAFNACQGAKEAAKGMYVSQQAHKPFGFVYRTMIGNDVLNTAYGYKLNFVYQAQAAPSERANETINDSPNAITFGWDFTTTPVTPETEGILPAAHVVINSTEVTAAQLKTIEDMIYGTDSNPAKLPSIDELIAIINPEGVEGKSLPVTDPKK